MNTRILKRGYPKLRVKSAALSILAFMFLSITANATTTTVPWTWTLEQKGTFDTNVNVENTGPMGTSKSDANSFQGAFIVSHTLTPPIDPGKGKHWVQVTPNPKTLLAIDGHWTGTLVNTTIGVDKYGIVVNTDASSSESLSGNLQAFNLSSEKIGGPGNQSFDHPSATSIIMGDATIPVAGSVEGSTLFGFGSGTLGDFVTAQSEVEVLGKLFNPAPVSITYKLVVGVVPEPETYAMMLAGLGLLSWRLRRTKN